MGVDDEAFATMMGEHVPGAYRLALRLCGDPHAAEEAVAEAVSRILVRWRAGAVRDPGAYLRRAVVNEVNDGFRRRALAQRFLIGQRGDHRGGLADDDRLADSDVFRIALARLAARQRAVVVLRYYEDMAQADVARVLGCSEGTVRSQLHRGLANLRRIVEELEGVPDRGTPTTEATA